MYHKKRYRMKRHHSKKVFRHGTHVAAKNTHNPMRGGWRI